MTFEISENSSFEGAVEDAHDELATDHGSDNVFVTAVDGEVVTVVGAGVGTIEAISVGVETPSAPDQEATTETPPSLDTGLFALFEEPRGWFEGVHDQFEMSVGGTGTICHLDQHGVSFQSFRKDLPSVIDHYREMNQQDTIGDAVVVADAVEAEEEVGERATWMQFESDRRVFVHEWVPFNEPATTKERLREELEEIMIDTPDFDQLFDQTREVFPYNMEPRHAETEAAK